MLNELYHVAGAMERQGLLQVRHPALDPMPKNAPTLLVRLDGKANPVRVEVVGGEIARNWLRVKHGSSGSAFPGFNIRAPLCSLPGRAEKEQFKRILDSKKSQNAAGADVVEMTRCLFQKAAPRAFTKRESDQFRRSVQELARWLQTDFANADERLTNFRRLLDLLCAARLDLQRFGAELAEAISKEAGEFSVEDRVLFARVLFEEKSGSKKTWSQPIFLDLGDDDASQLPVADSRMGELLNRHLLAFRPKPYDSSCRRAGVATEGNEAVSETPSLPQHRDAYSGQPCDVTQAFPDPKVAVLGNVRLFSNNTNEAACFFRYSQGGSETFKVSKETAERLSGALLSVAGERGEGTTCKAIPGNKSKRDARTGKSVIVRELLCVYLEDEPHAPEAWVELFGQPSEESREADFVAAVKPVIEALEGRANANPSQLLRLFTICPLDKANKQVSLHRVYTVKQVLDAARAWETGAGNCPPVSLPVRDPQTRRTVLRPRCSPAPLEAAVLLNRVWSSDSRGLRATSQRAVTVADAYDLFLGPVTLRLPKAQGALNTLLARCRPVFTRSAIFKVTRDYRELDQINKRYPFSELGRWQALKAVALTGILLHHLGHQYDQFMKDTIYHIGRLLALADSLHFQYCKWVRTSDEKRKQGKVDAPTELLGNSLFNFALDSPVSALARLAERIRPYKGWADTYDGEDAGLVHWFVRQMADCERQCDLATLPKRIDDVHKAQLLLGYLADLKPQTNNE